MSGNDTRLSRRQALKATGSAVVAGALVTGTTGASGPDEYVVGFETGADPGVAADAADSVKRTLDFGDIGTAVAGRFSSEALDQLAARDDVRYVEEDGTMRAFGPGGEVGPPGGGGGSGNCLPWGVDRVDGDVAAANGYTGSGADVAIIDTGIDPDHPDLKSLIGSGKAFVECKGGSKECDGKTWADDEGHGTHCAGTACAIDGNNEGVKGGVATEATLHAVKVLDKRGSGSYSDVASGIKYTADQGWDVGSMSLGGGKSSVVEDACEYAYGKGVLLVAAAGNDGPCSDCVGYPAAEPEVIAVSATTKSDSLASFSSTGPEVELAAPGDGVYSTYDDGAYDTLSGTSMSCPHVSGAGAIRMAQGDDNATARQNLKDAAEDIGLGSNESGAGLLDAAAAVGLDSSDDGTGSC